MPVFNWPARVRRPPDSAQVAVPDHVDGAGVGGGDGGRRGDVRAERLDAGLVLQLGGDSTIREVLSVLAPFGRVVVIGVPGGRQLTLDEAAVRAFFHDPALNQSLHAFNLGLFFGLRPRAAAAALTTLVGHVAAGRVTVPVGTVLPLEEAARAHRLLEERATTGKVVLTPWA